MSGPLNTASLLSLLPTLLPQGTTSPLPQSTDAIAALVHTIHAALQFRLVSPAPQPAEDNFKLEQPGYSGDNDDTMSEVTAVEQEDSSQPPAGRLAEGWNSRGEDSYSFQYRHDQSAMNFRIRIGKMGNRAQIDAMAEDGEPLNLSIVISELVDSGLFPIPSSATASSAFNQGSPNASATAVGFKSVNDVKAFVEKYRRNVISRLLPGLSIPGYNEASGSDPRAPPAGAPRGGEPSPARPVVPRTGEPFLDNINNVNPSGRNPASVGHRDLDPLASLRPPGSFNPTRDGGGMLMDFNHPIFDSRRGRGFGDPDLDGPGGSIQPPGSRWDPVGPSPDGVGGGGIFPGVGGNPLGGVGRGDRDRWGDEMPPPGEFGPDLGRSGGGSGIGGPLGGDRGGGRFGDDGGFGGRSGFGGGFGGNMFM
ncbi:hypothetical protein I308_102967 [Cryptococcus tetragattii IND107]|uniref:Proteasome inhibitor PI31 subunit n=1 Tax=Cryptococcus tetragattii IND107 TaxID=1296105 RepID=A0ABR3BVM6_9TREE|nr:hypothetical protein I308_06670 [Cryptococcus tetragattii IND107]